MRPSPFPSSRPTSGDGPPSSPRRSLALASLSLAYLAFVIYGSLVPWRFRQVPWEAALERFEAMRYLDLGIGSRADWVANILLFVPLAFLLMLWLAREREHVARLAIALAVTLFCVSLSVGIEFVQIFFPPRTVSRNDVLAECIGALVGVAAWAFLGRAVMRYVDSWGTAIGNQGVADRALWLYLAIVFGYGVLPLDLTVSPVEVYHKWQQGKVALVPFSHSQGEGALAIYNLLADVATWVPVALLLVASGRRSAARAWGLTVGLALALEGMQLFVYSRVTDSTDLVTATVGGGLGAWSGSRWRGGDAAVPGREGGPRFPWLPIIAAAAWVVVLLVVFWYPFELDLDRRFLRGRAELLLRAPFTAYYYGTEFRAVTEVMHKLAFFAPLGVLLGVARNRLPTRGARTALTVLAIGLIAAVAGGIELAQVAMPGKVPSTTDWGLALLGGCTALWLTGRLGGRAAVASRAREDGRPRHRSGRRRRRRPAGSG